MPSINHHPTREATWFVYLLECSGDYLYTGIATNVRERFEKHCAGRGAAFTRINKPVRVLAAMPCANRSDASKAEARLKKLRRGGKLAWAAEWSLRDQVALIPKGRGQRPLLRKRLLTSPF